MFGALNRLGVSVKKALSGNAVGSSEPSLAFNFDINKYVANGTKNFNQAITHDRSGNATMVDSDGLLKWAPHNLLTYSEDFSNAVWNKASASVSVGSDYTTLTASTGTGNHWIYHSGPTGPVNIAIEAKAGTVSFISLSSTSPNSDGAYFNLSSGSVGTIKGSDTASIEDLGDGWFLCEVQFASDEEFFTLTIANADNSGSSWNAVGTETVLIRNARAYRSDLGGMVDNPARGDSYVPTTSAARYLPRVGHHVYNGTAWANEGMLHESEARTNLITYSNTLNDASFGGLNATVTTAYANSPLGADTATRLIDDGATGSAVVGWADLATVVSTSSVYTFWVFLKADQLSWAYLETRSFTTPGNVQTYFDLANGVVGTVGAGHTPHILDYGDGWYLCGITFTTDASDTSGQPRVYVAEADATTSVNRDGTSSILMAGWQFEAGSTPSSYIPTSGSTVTRAADTLTVPSANLPWPTPEYIGPELVTNGDFSADSDWTLNGTATISSGTGKNLTSGDYIAQSFTTEAGKYYQLTFDALPGSNSGNSLVRIGTSANSFSIQSSSLGTTGTGLIRRFVATGATTWVTFYQSNFTAEYDNISVREINPLSVSIQMDGLMTYADENTFGTAKHFTWEESSTKYIRSTLNTEGARTGAIWFEQRELTSGIDIVISPSTYYSPGINVPYNIASRHGSTFINGAVDGTALTANLTPTALPDLSATDFNLGYDFMGTIGTLRVWAQDLTDEGIVDATEPSLEPSLSLTFDSTESSFIVEDWT